ncbi:hypothetical protein [Alicyclobacillus herbarius]|uniref:hypothetical protein n=1 Tax=Alicyclobacillus herbarius TaxID=122960 RepID=UPI0004184B9C|nr:hypothetical protein [Alicyclobacillus herbarius]
MSQDPAYRRFQGVIERIDRFLLPVAAGCLSFTLLVQGVERIPTVRARIDMAANRFQAVPKEVIPASAQVEQATIKVYLSPVTAVDTPIEVLRNGHSAGSFQRASFSLTVRDGDQIMLYAPLLEHDLTVEVDHDNPRLLSPAPGWTAVLGPHQNRVDLPSTKFTV